MIKKYVQKILEGELLDFQEALELATQVEPSELYVAADKLRKSIHNNVLDLCSIVNAKSGQCTENCKFCAQSEHYDVEVTSYDVIDLEQAIEVAKKNESHGVQRFSLVTAGHSVSEIYLDEFRKIYKKLEEETGLSLCASMGFLTPEKAQKLKEMGVTRYHCNLETSRSYFPEVCTTHSWDEKVETIKIARDAGLDVCSGGIIGMGETLEQRLELAFELRELDILSIPINILTPIKDTPFENLVPLKVSEILTAVAMFRFINPNAIIRLAGGRGLLADEQDKYFTSGANGALVGDYLTTTGSTLEDDLVLFERLGFSIQPKE